MKDPHDLPSDKLIALSNSIVDQQIERAIEHITDNGMLYASMLASQIQQDAIKGMADEEPITVAKSLFADVGIKVCLMKIAERMDEESKDE